MNLRLFTGNRLETLAEALAEALRTPLASPLDEEVVVIQSQGMRRWVSMQLALRHEICANYRFYFPNAFVHHVFRKLTPDLPEQSPYDPEIMTWRIRRLLPDCIKGPGFEGLRAYLGDSGGDLKAFQLSERIADTFDQYLLFRPEMILRWERGEEDHWQAVLWRELARENGEGRHRASLAKTFLDGLRKTSTGRGGLPERVSVFGISAIPRFHMGVLAGMSRFAQVNLFLMNPCKKYWGDILSEWEMRGAAGREGRPDLTDEALHLEKGNSLLASMGRLGRDFFDLINELGCEEYTLFDEPGEGNLLSCIQSDILNLRERQGALDGGRTVEGDDTSIQIHSCHSPMREIEVLQDRLLDMFERDPSLMPKDILVMAPDIETYAPYVQAVFDLPADDPRRIPFSISDRSVRKESEIIETFLAIMDLQGSRFGAPQVLGILESRSVQRKFGLMETDLDLIRRWVRETRIRWGIDGQDRSHMGLPAFPENTWRAGLDRLLLGYAMPGEGENMFEGVLPYDRIEGQETSVLGEFIEFADLLFTRVAPLGRPRTLEEWSGTLTGLLERFFAADEEREGEVQVIRRTLSEMYEMQRISNFDKEIDIRAIRWHLGQSLEREGFGYGFINGNVTFCAMLPMRSIPFRIICLVGMNGDAYPRQAKPIGFDLMAKHPRPGDRSRRNDDRYLFLETILSARERLYISFVGQSIQDNSPAPPSVLVSELMDYIEQGFVAPGEKILDRIVTRHRLQAFSPEYFKENERLFSFSEENFRAARCITEARETPVPFISRGISEPEEEWKTVALEDLCRFFGNPTRFLLKSRLDIHLGERAEILEEREAFEIEGLERYLLEEGLVGRRLEGRDLGDFLPLTQATGQLPHGTVGECVYENLSKGIERFVARTGPYMQGTTLEPLEVDLKISGFRLRGRIDALYPERLIQYRYARIRPRDRLKTWVHHLALNCLAVENYPRRSMLAGLRTKGERELVLWEYSPVEESEELLGRLLERYWEGLVRPLHFFPESSWEYASTFMEKNKPREEALRVAGKKWAGSEYSRGECEDSYYKLCFEHSDPLDSEFQEIAEEVFGPLLGHQKEAGK